MTCQKLGGDGAGVARRRKKQFSKDHWKTSGCESKGIGQKDTGRPVQTPKREALQM